MKGEEEKVVLGACWLPKILATTPLIQDEQVKSVHFYLTQCWSGCLLVVLRLVFGVPRFEQRL